MFETSLFSVVFVIAALVVAVVLLAPLLGMWARFANDIDKALKAGVKTRSWAGPAVTTVLAVGAYIVVLSLGWSAIVNANATKSDYKAQAEIQEQKKVQESQLPSQQELDQTRAEQKQVQQAKPHKEALDSYDESMKQEAEKIRQRNK